jgi:hypothetical protein
MSLLHNIYTDPEINLLRSFSQARGQDDVIYKDPW